MVTEDMEGQSEAGREMARESRSRIGQRERKKEREREREREQSEAKEGDAKL